MTEPRHCLKLLIVLLTFACSNQVRQAPRVVSTNVAPKAPVTSVDFRKTPPLPGPEIAFSPPVIQELKLENGVRILLVERHELPIVAVNIAIDSGAEEGGPGVAGFVSAMLFSGTKRRSALSISDELGSLGASYSHWADYDGMGVRAQVLPSKLSAVMDILGDVVREPAFDAKEFARERARRLTSIAQENDEPWSLLRKYVATNLYPASHPYASSLLGTAAAVEKISRADLVRHHAARFAPQHLTLAFAGDISRETALSEARRVFGTLKGKREPRTNLQELAPNTRPRILLVDRPGLTQAFVSVGIVGPARNTPDFDALTVMNTILGGQFSSRLNLNLREAHAYTYGVRSGFDFRHGPGPFTSGGAIVLEHTLPALREILNEIERIRNSTVSAQELTDAKQNLIRNLPARFESSGETAATLIMLSVLGLPLDEFATRPARYAQIAEQDVQRVAKLYLRAEDLRIVVVGDAARIQGLEALGFGPVLLESLPGTGKNAKPTQLKN
jgi:predicted Zn-dependent peptidase